MVLGNFIRGRPETVGSAEGNLTNTQCCSEGFARMTLFASSGNAQTVDFEVRTFVLKYGAVLLDTHDLLSQVILVSLLLGSVS